MEAAAGDEGLSDAGRSMLGSRLLVRSPADVWCGVKMPEVLGRLLPAASPGDLLRSIPDLVDPEAAGICRCKTKGGRAPPGVGMVRLGTGPEVMLPEPGVRIVRMLAEEGARERLMMEGEGGGTSPLIVPAVVARLLLLVTGRAAK